MQFRTVALSLFVALAAADNISDLAAKVPSCARPCIASAAEKAGCDATDYKCQCGKALEITSNSALCTTTSCSKDDTNEAYKSTTDLCLAVAGQAGSDALSSFTSAVGGAFTSATGAVGSAFTEATGAAGSAFSSATDAAGSAFSSATDAAGSAASPTPTPGAANHPAVAGMGMGMVGAAAVFALAL
ncbi:hypothetical protein F5Y14DRAFT_417588 [Nemania sp. NC0429]|nr:hypothetical protein F5Y14DRAFT_417588 [Nemania sp. NC0429]